MAEGKKRKKRKYPKASRALRDWVAQRIVVTGNSISATAHNLGVSGETVRRVRDNKPLRGSTIKALENARKAIEIHEATAARFRTSADKETGLAGERETGWLVDKLDGSRLGRIEAKIDVILNALGIQA